jgi:NAD(P)-dependent dehydrogenase (short-subunit alcohol dehydrogenase family)
LSGGRLAGRVAVVTGGTRGIGRAIAARLLEDGAEVLVTGRTAGGAGPAGTRYTAVEFSDSGSIDHFAAALSGLAPDILVNNAGINRIAPFSEIDLADFVRIQQVNVTAAFRFCQAVLPGMRRKGWGRIVSISSIWGKVSRAGRASYSTSKFALDGMTVALAAEVAAEGILVNCVAPGVIESDMTRQVLGPEGIAELSAQIPAARLGRPDEVAAFVAWMVSPENSYITGQNIAIDGGFTRV